MSSPNASPQPHEFPGDPDETQIVSGYLIDLLAKGDEVQLEHWTPENGRHLGKFAVKGTYPAEQGGGPVIHYESPVEVKSQEVEDEHETVSEEFDHDYAADPLEHRADEEAQRHAAWAQQQAESAQRAANRPRPGVRLHNPDSQQPSWRRPRYYE